MTNDSQKPTTNDAGIPVPSDEFSLTVGPDGPILLQDHYLIEQYRAVGPDGERELVAGDWNPRIICRGFLAVVRHDNAPPLCLRFR